MPPAARHTSLLLCAALLVATAAVYAPVRHFDFINMDDPDYVFQNAHVPGGLTRDTFMWALTDLHEAEWHPLTTLSHLVVCSLFGLNPGPHHLMNVALHVVATLLLFGVLTDMTMQPWRSAVVAALFALHPAHVESVAWIAQRKDEMVACFWMLTIWAYCAYTRRPGARSYTLLFLAYLGAMASKPIAVTLPFVLLLVDVWPLQRIQWASGDRGTAARTLLPEAPWATLLLEKLPLFLLAAIVSVVTFYAQHGRGVFNEQLRAPFADRLANAIVAYTAYLWELLYPVNLGVLYPFEIGLPMARVIGAAVLLAAISAAVLWGTRRHPYLFTGWFWYLGTLLPVIGLVQFNDSSMADRYSYFPSIGIFIIAAWGIPELLGRWQFARVAEYATAGVAILACTIMTSRQLGYWAGSVPLFEHTAAVTRDNLIMHSALGSVLLDSEEHRDAAFAHFLEATRICDTTRSGPTICAQAHYNIGVLLAKRGDRSESEQHYRAALRFDPSYAKAHLALGQVVASAGDLGTAKQEYREAIRLDPNLAAAHANLAIALEGLGQNDEAIVHYAEGVRLEPQNAGFRCNLAGALASAGRLAEAVEQYQAALRINPTLAAAREGLAAASAALSQHSPEGR